MAVLTTKALTAEFAEIAEEVRQSKSEGFKPAKLARFF